MNHSRHPFVCCSFVALCAAALAPRAAAQSAAAAPGEAASAPEVRVLERVLVPGKRAINIGPMPGLDIGKDQIPANVQSATKQEIKDSRALNIGDYMNSQLQGVSVNDYAGNPFQLDVNYRGFTASPQVGTPQGLSVFFDGVRVNEPFGDVVNWDLIPLNAIERFDLFPGSNPLFGLNTLGGAISVRGKSGFTSPGLEAGVLAGSWKRRQLQLSGGGNDGTFGGFLAYTGFKEDGWRDNSPSRVHQLYGRGDWRGEKSSLFATVLLADNRLVGNGLIPIELYRERPEAVFTSPDEGKNKLAQLVLGGEIELTKALNVTAQVYRRKSDRSGFNGDIYAGFDDFGDLDTATGPDGNGIGRNGATRQAGFTGAGVVEGTPIGLITATALKQTTDGGSLQFNWNLERHALMVGTSIDRSKARYEMFQRLGLIDASHRVFLAPDRIDPDYYAAGDNVPGNNFSGTSTTKSLYFSDTWTPVPSFTLTTAARYNHTDVDNDLLVRTSQAQVDLHELRRFRQDEFLIGPVFRQTLTKEELSYRSFNPSIGGNWRPQDGLNLFGNLSRGARTPSVVELGCAFDGTPVPDPDFPLGPTFPRSLNGPGCNLPTTLSGDPFLPQIRSKSGEVGFRHRFAKGWEWNASIYRTDLKDDIYFVGVSDGRSYFDTVGKTRRQGLELGVNGSFGPLDVKFGYSYTDATFQSTFYTVSRHNSSADFDQNSAGTVGQGTFGFERLPTPTASENRGFGTYRMIRTDPGARLPGIPAHALNLNFGYRVTPGWKLGLGVIARSLSYMRGNENNLHRPSGTDQETGLYTCPTGGGGCETTGFLQNLTRPGRGFREEGEVPGYFIFNLDTTITITKGVNLFAQVTNLFDRKYYTAGRLGVNPFSPSTNGAIGESGWNYNSSEWQNTSLVAPGAPRGIFVGLTWELDAAN